MNRQKMKLARRLAGYRHTDTLPPDLHEAVQKLPDLKLEWEQSQRLVSLLSLKQYERPDPDVASRCRSSVLRQLRSVDEEETYPIFDWQWNGITPIFRFGLAALFLAFIGLQLLQSPNPEPVSAHQAELGTLPFTPTIASEPARAQTTATAGTIDFSQIGITNWPPRAQQAGSVSFVSFGQ